MRILAALFALILTMPAHAQTRAVYSAECLPAQAVIDVLKSEGFVGVMIGVTDYKTLGQVWMDADGKWKFAIREEGDLCIIAAGDYAMISLPEFKAGVEH